jgi:hypothetical protein
VEKDEIISQLNCIQSKLNNGAEIEKVAKIKIANNTCQTIASHAY